MKEIIDGAEWKSRSERSEAADVKRNAEQIDSSRSSSSTKGLKRGEWVDEVGAVNSLYCKFLLKAWKTYKNLLISYYADKKPEHIFDYFFKTYE